MLTLDVVVQLVAVVLSVAFGLMVFAGGPRRAPNVFLALFLLLIAANQATEAARGFLGDGHQPWFLAGSVFAALDPLFLYYFLSIYPQRSALNRPAYVAAVAAVSCALALAIAWIPSGRSITLPWQGTATLSAIVYTVLLAFVARRLRDAPEPEPPLRLLLPALSIAAIPAWIRVGDAWLSTGSLVSGAAGMVLVLGVAYGVAVATLLLLAREASTAPRHAHAPFRFGMLAAVVLAAPMTARSVERAFAFATSTPLDSFAPLTSGAIAARWVGFGLLVSLAVLRYDMLGMTLAARRRAARVTVGGMLVLGAAVGLTMGRVLPTGGFGLSLAQGVVIVGIILVSRSFRDIVDRVAQKVYGVPMPGDVTAALGVYRHAATAAAREGRGMDAPLLRLRDELGLAPSAAALVEELAFGRSGTLEPGALVAGRYRVARLLARGGHGTAYLARDESLGRDVVLKDVPGGAAGALAARQEADAVRGLDHPHVVGVLDLVERPEGALLVCEFASGGTLAERVQAEGRLPVMEGLALLDGLLAGLEAIHARGIVHRDLKPSNILLDAEGRARIADFGLARATEETTAPLGAPLRGTPAYMAPEVRHGARASPASDVYAAALVARRCIRSPLPPSVDEVITRALDENPAERFAHAGEMRVAVAEAITRAA